MPKQLALILRNSCTLSTKVNMTGGRDESSDDEVGDDDASGNDDIGGDDDETGNEEDGEDGGSDADAADGDDEKIGKVD